MCSWLSHAEAAEGARARELEPALVLYTGQVALRTLRVLVRDLSRESSWDAADVGFHAGEDDGAGTLASAKFVRQLNWLLEYPSAGGGAREMFRVFSHYYTEEAVETLTIGTAVGCAIEHGDWGGEGGGRGGWVSE